ncbi:MAG: hypothetical protein F6K21_33970 [Symploca sp. SIO2D2]|nr:hypothetical protein [Symploca sp. SIO2D2]NER19591.1 hypothetical protein [Symploca sp. SIO1C2]
MIQQISKKVPRGSRIDPSSPSLSPEEIARIEAQEEEFGRCCRAIFDQVYPELVKEHYDWFILIEPNSGDYFIAPNHEAALQKARQKHLKADILAMRLNETGTCGRI